MSVLAFGSRNHFSAKLVGYEVEPIANSENGNTEREHFFISRWGVVVIDRNYRILSVNGFARRLLGIRDIANDQDFLHAVRGLPYAQVRQAIDSTFREHNHVVLDAVELESSAGGDGRYVNLSVMPVQTDSGSPELVVVCVSDSSEFTKTRRQLEESQVDHARLASDLGSTNKRLSDVNKELQDANEELQAANEELMLTQEELQATNEEFEATNEELQATNEELETNNEELQATNEELQTTNDELSARTSELQDATRRLTVEQKRLAEIIEHAPYYMLVMRGPSLLIERYNPRYRDLFGGRDNVGRPLEEVFGGPETDELVRLVRECYSRDRALTTVRMSFRITGERGEQVNDIVHTIVPVHDAEGKVDGVVIYAENVTEREGQRPCAGEALKESK